MPLRSHVVIVDSYMRGRIFRVVRNVTNVFFAYFCKRSRGLRSLRVVVVFRRRGLQAGRPRVLYCRVWPQGFFLGYVGSLVSQYLSPFTVGDDQTIYQGFPMYVGYPRVISPCGVGRFITVASPIRPRSMVLFLRVLPIVSQVSPSLSYDARVVEQCSNSRSQASVYVGGGIVFSAPCIRKVLSRVREGVSRGLSSDVIYDLLRLRPLYMRGVLGGRLVLYLYLRLYQWLLSILQPNSMFFQPIVPTFSIVYFLWYTRRAVLVCPFL